MKMEVIDSRYYLIKKLGSGAMGDVFLAKDHLFADRLVALKTIRDHIMTRQTIDSFKREFEVLTLISHPGILKVMDFGFDSDNCLFYFTNEYLEGRTLRQFLDEGRKFSLNEVLDYAVLIGRALDFIHSRYIIHRDIKPANLMLAGNIIKLMDFGLADMNIKDTSCSKGTISYFAPENLKSKGQYITDIYQLGLLIGELITNASFFANKSPDDILRTLEDEGLFENEKLKFLSIINDPDLRAFISRLIAYKVEDRYQSCAEMVLDINKIFHRSYDLEDATTIDAYFHNVPIVGRQRELDITKCIIQNEINERTIIVQGPFGIGKTCLLNEVKKFCQVNHIQYFEGKCIEDDLTSYLPFLDILENMLLYVPDMILQRTAPEIVKLLPFNKRLKDFSSRSCSNLNISRDLITDAVCGLILGYSQEQSRPVTIHFKDMHWADQGTVNILKSLCYKLSRGDYFNIKVILSFNSEIPLDFNFIDFFNKNKVLNRNIVLKPLNSDETAQLLESIFGRGHVGKSLLGIRNYLMERSFGNPLYCIEILRGLIYQGIIQKQCHTWELSDKFNEEIEIPTLFDLISKRIDSISFSNIQLKALQLLAICRQAPTIEEISLFLNIEKEESGSVLSGLLDTEIIRYQKENDEVRYAISNPVAGGYIRNQMDNDLKKQYNSIIAKGIEGLYGDDNGQYLEALALHYYDAEEMEKASQYLLLSAKQAEKGLSFLKCISFYEKLIRAINQDDKKQMMKIYQNMSESYKNLNKLPKALKLLEKACEIALQTGSQMDIAKQRHRISQIYTLQSKHKEALQILNDIKSIYEKEQDLRNLNSVYNDLGNVYWNIGEYTRANENYKKQIEIAERLNDKRGLAKAYNNIGLINFHRGAIEEARECYEKSLEIALKIDDLIIANIPIGNLGLIYYRKKDYKKALEYYNRKLAITRKFGLEREVSMSLLNISDIYSDMGEYEKAISIYKEQIELTLFINDKYLYTISTLNLGTVYKETGDLMSAQDSLHTAHRTAESIGNKELVAVALINLGDVYKIYNDLEKTLECYNNAINTAESIELKLYLPYFYYVKADLDFIRNDFKSCLEFVEKGQTISQELNDPSLLFDLKLIKMRALYSSTDDKAEKQSILEELKALSIAGGEDREIALICYSIWVLSGEFYFGYCALSYYKKIYTAVKKQEYKDIIEELENKLQLKHQDLELTYYFKEIYKFNEHDRVSNAKLYRFINNMDISQKLDYFASEIAYSCNSKYDSDKIIKRISKIAKHIKYIIRTADFKINDKEVSKPKDNNDFSIYADEIDKDVSSIITGNTYRDIKNVEMLLEAIKASSSTLDLNILLVRIMDMILNVTEAERGFILLKEKEDEKLTVCVKRSKDPDEKEITEDFSKSIPYKVFHSGVPICLKDTAVESATMSMLDLNLRSVMCVPLQIRNYRFGVVYVDSHTALKEFSNSDLSFFNALTSQVAGAIENARLYKEAVELTNKVQKYNEEMLKLKNLLDNVINSIPSMIFAVDLNDRVIMWNTTASNFTGIQHKNIINRELWQEIPCLASYKMHKKDVLSTKRTVNLHKETLSFPHCQGLFYNVLISPLTGAKNEGVVFRIDDVTEIEKKNQQLVQAQKLEIVGTLASGLAHDFNNILGVLIGSTSLIQMKVESLEDKTRLEIVEYLESMNIAIERAKNLIRQLIGLTRKGKEDFILIDLNHCIKNIISLCKMSLDKRVMFNFSLYKEECYIMGNASQIEQALLNLSINATHAMTIMREENEYQGGSLLISINKFYADEDFCQAHIDIETGNYWKISIKDNGVGMDPETIDRIFDPFYTTKSKEVGSGLGLFMVYDIIKRHSGLIVVDSKPGEGTRFDIYLPRLE